MLNAMNHLNRAIVIVFLLVLCSASLGLGAVIGYDLVHGYSFGSGSGAGILGRAIDTVADRSHALLMGHALPVLGISAVVGVLLFLMLWAELRSAVTQPQLVLSRGHLGQVAISLDQVGMLAQHETELIAGVREVRTTAESKKAGLEVQQTIAVEPEHQLPALAEQIQQRVKQSLEYHLGFPVAAVRVQLQQASLSKALL